MSDDNDHGESRPNMEALTPEEIEAFRSRLQSQETPAEAADEKQAPAEKFVEPLVLARDEIAQLEADFFAEVSGPSGVPAPDLVQGIIFDFDCTLAELTRPLDELMQAGAQSAVDYMRSTGMELPKDFWTQVVEARRFAEEKSAEEKEEHIADDAMSFLLQFYGYPASQMDLDVLHQAVDLFYAPEMTAWGLRPGALELLGSLAAEGYRIAVLANYNCDRVFQRTVDYLGLRPYLDICISSALVEFRKPDEQFFNIVLDRWDTLPYEVIVVGDSLVEDIQGGIDLGALTVQVEGETTPQVAHDNEQLAGEIVPDARISDLTQIADLVKRWATP